MFRVLATLAILAAPAEPLSAFPYEDRPFDLLRDLHLTAYEPDPRWRKAWADAQHGLSGIDFVHGSISQHELYTERRIVLNAPVYSDRVRFRFEHEEVGSLDLETARDAIELQFRVAGPVALTVSGFPAYDKAQSSGGAGVLVADSSRRRYLDLGFELGAPLYNERAREDARYARAPVRWLAETNYELGDFRVHAMADLGRQSRRVHGSPSGSGGVRDLRTRLQRIDVALEWSPGHAWMTGARHRRLVRSERREHFEGYLDPEIVLEDFDFARTIDRTDGYADWIGKAWRVRGQVSGVWARDQVALAYEPDYRYRRDELIAGGRVHWLAPVDGLQVGVGYWGNVYRAKLAAGAMPISRRHAARASETGAGYLDKADLVVGYAVTDRIRTEGIVSQQVTRGRFGGGSLKATVLF